MRNTKKTAQKGKQSVAAEEEYRSEVLYQSIYDIHALAFAPGPGHVRLVLKCHSVETISFVPLPEPCQSAGSCYHGLMTLEQTAEDSFQWIQLIKQIQQIKQCLITGWT